MLFVDERIAELLQRGTCRKDVIEHHTLGALDFLRKEVILLAMAIIPLGYAGDVGGLDVFAITPNVIAVAHTQLAANVMGEDAPSVTTAVHRGGGNGNEIHPAELLGGEDRAEITAYIVESEVTGIVHTGLEIKDQAAEGFEISGENGVLVAGVIGKERIGKHRAKRI